MALRFRKSKNLGLGARLNLSTKGIGISTGVQGLRVGVGPRGGRATASIPGTGIYTTKTSNFSSSKTGSAQSKKLQKELQRELEKKAKQITVKMEVEEYESYMEGIQSLHKECSSAVDWNEMKGTPAPFEGDKGPREEGAMYTLENYKPGFFARLFRLVGRQRKKLELSVEEAKRSDQEEYTAWQEKVTIATEVLNHNEEAYNYALDNYTPLEELQDIGGDLEFELLAPEKLMISFQANEDSVIPYEVKSISPTGRLSVRQMQIGKFNEAYQDYVCSASLRMAREAFAVLPIHTLYLHAQGGMLDTMTGFEKKETILSVKFDRATLEGLNFDLLDPSDSMQNFEHNMDLMKTKGFQVVKKLEYSGKDRSNAR